MLTYIHTHAAYTFVQVQSRAEPPKKKVRSEEIERQRREARSHVGLTETMLSLNPARTKQVRNLPDVCNLFTDIKHLFAVLKAQKWREVQT
jgi:hypothetical protein